MAHRRVPGLARGLRTLAIGLVLGSEGSATAATLTVSPVSVDLGPKASTALVTVKNNGNREVGFEVGVYAWTQDENGKMELAATDDVVVFPVLSAVAPNAEKKIRVGLVRRGGTAAERTYRLFLDEMAPPRTEAGAGSVTLQMRIGIPIFVAPAKSKGSAVLEAPAARGGRLRFRVANPGNAHVLLQSVTVTTEDPGGAPIGRHELPAWYLLAGGVRAYDVPLGRDECLAAKAFRIETKWVGGSVASRTERTPGGCD